MVCVFQTGRPLLLPNHCKHKLCWHVQKIASKTTLLQPKNAHPAMEETKVKFRKLEDLRRSTPYCSQTSLSAIIAHIKEHGRPEVSSRSSMSRACSAALEGDFHYGPLQLDIELELKTGGKTTVPCNNLLSYLDVLYSSTSSFKGLLDQRHSTLGV